MRESENLSPESEHPEIQLCDHRDSADFPSLLVDPPPPRLPCVGKRPNRVFSGKSLFLIWSTAFPNLSATVLPNSVSFSEMLSKVLETSGAAWAGAGPAQKRGRGATISGSGALRMSFQGWKRRCLNRILGGHSVRTGRGWAAGAVRVTR